MEGFHTKGRSKIFLVVFSTFLVKIVFFRVQKDSTPKISTQPETTKFFYKILTLKAGTGKLLGNNGFDGVIFSYLGY